MQQGVSTWNRWRVEYPDISPNLANANLKDLNLEYVNLSSCNFSGADLYNTNFNKSMI
ncbi:MAG: pentapeptide repeat-containing protein [Oscillatoriales cyanobacterium RM2_1_1]|nr:pentapeptide repeat-containing protein [Oscillatoriales cyanobacterium SM2_3_0]NJO47984.1 pentapeptide repeat-containing protein [Oscillatoriales cyanobacterium RM2_1_1]